MKIIMVVSHHYFDDTQLSVTSSHGLFTHMDVLEN